MTRDKRTSDSEVRSNERLDSTQTKASQFGDVPSGLSSEDRLTAEIQTASRYVRRPPNATFLALSPLQKCSHKLWSTHA